MADLTLDPELAELAGELRKIRNERRALEEAEKRIRENLVAALKQADATYGLTASGERVLRLTESTRTGVNRSKLEALYPEIFDQVKTESTVVTLNLI